MDNAALAKLVTKARNGCQDSIGLLTEQFQDELYRYIYRLTLNQSVTEDVLQETLLQMCSSIRNLCDVNNIKPWLFKTAWGKTMNHYRSAKKQQHMSIHQNNLINALENRRLEGLKTLISKEIAETLVQSISQLDVKQRNVLILRCYENLSYSEIASMMDCSETTARVLFFRAKNKLKQRLSRKGITVPMFLGLLGLFGQVTSRAEAAVTVSASTLKVGGLGTVIGWGLSKIGTFILSMVAGTAIVTSVALLKSAPSDYTFGGPDNGIKSFHFIKHSWKDAYIPNANLLMGKSLSKGGYEQWFFFPEGVEGPLFKMMQRWDPQIKNKLCSWLLNEDGQHYYHSGQKKIYLMNGPLARRKTERFPCDSPEFCAFLDSMEGKEEGIDYVRDPKTGLLMEMIDRRFANAKDFSSNFEYNNLDEKTFGDFRYQWPENTTIIDERDSIHQQGWTLFQIAGQINGKPVNGSCRIPFLYSTCQEYPPLLILHVGNRCTLIDSPSGAFVVDANNKAIGSYPAGSFFRGLMRPWFGLHTIDLFRREAAKSRIPFELENLEYDGYSYQRRILTLHDAPGHENVKISIDINIDQDQIQQVDFLSNDDSSFGSLKFTYPDSPEAIDETIEIPAVKKRWFSNERHIGIEWLFDLAEESLGK